MKQNDQLGRLGVKGRSYKERVPQPHWGEGGQGKEGPPGKAPPGRA